MYSRDMKKIAKILSCCSHQVTFNLDAEGVLSVGAVDLSSPNRHAEWLSEGSLVAHLISNDAQVVVEPNSLQKNR